MQLNRLFEMVYMLLNKKRTTAAELAEHFEVSVRTIYRDIDTLSAAGIPIYASRGKGGGISLLDDYVLDKLVLSDTEQNEILFALQSLAIAENPASHDVLSKVNQLFNKTTTDWIEVDLSPWGSSSKAANEFSMLKNAILERKIITFTYINNIGDKSIRRVEPLKLIFKVQAWCVQGFCLTKKDYRLFKISRMNELHVTDDFFAERPIKPPASTVVRTPHIAIELHIAASGAYRVFDDFNEAAITTHADGSFTVHTSLPDGDWLYRFILSYGTAIEVIAPDSLRQTMHQQLTQILQHYKS